MEKNVQQKYRLYRRRNGRFYWQDNESSKQGSLETRDRRIAEKLLNAMNVERRPLIVAALRRRTWFARSQTIAFFENRYFFVCYSAQKVSFLLNSTI
jgi:hypothetical protein